MVITAIAAALFVLIYRIICAVENRRRDRMGTPEDFDHAFEDDLTDKMVSVVSSWSLVLTRCRTCSLGMFYNGAMGE